MKILLISLIFIILVGCTKDEELVPICTRTETDVETYTDIIQHQNWQEVVTMYRISWSGEGGTGWFDLTLEQYNDFVINEQDIYCF